MTDGQERIRLTPNENGPSKRAKDIFINLIDFCDEFSYLDPRVAEQAKLKLEDASHWVVKLVTTKKN